MRVLNIESLIRAIKSIWYTFNSDLILNEDNIEDPHPYVNLAYEDYMELYEENNNNLSYIHPLLFPKIFQLVFINNQIPKTRYELNNPVNINYNDRITINNIGYINNIDTILYIYRVHDNRIPNKKIGKKNKKIGKGNNKIGKENNKIDKENRINNIINEIKLYRKRLQKLLKV